MSTNEPAHTSIQGCAGCGRDFPGPTGASDYVAHICYGYTPRQRDEEHRQLHKRRQLEDTETALCNAFGDMVDLVGLPSAMEALARDCESWGREASGNNPHWQDIANAMAALGEDFGKQGYGELERT